MKLLWKILAFVLSRPAVVACLIGRARRTPYFHLPGYMSRWWLFNGYDRGVDGESDADRQKRKRFPTLPSIRIHHILREDLARHLHDHPWNARTIILDGWYIERRESGSPRVLRAGDTATIAFGEYHHIERVSDGGVFTLFIVGAYGGRWGFLVDGEKMPPREYSRRYPERA